MRRDLHCFSLLVLFQLQLYTFYILFSELAAEEPTVEDKKERVRKHIEEMQEKRETVETVAT